MTTIIHYSMNESLETVEHGPITKDEALQIVDKYAAMQIGLTGSAEEVIAKSVFGFCLDERRFIEIAMETESVFRMRLEMPASRRILFWSLPSTYQKEITIDGLARLHDLITHFFDQSLEDFRHYFELSG